MITSFRGPYFFLSNFYPHPFTYDNIIWQSSEHAYQASKCADERLKIIIMHAVTPSDAKKFGKYVELVFGWEDKKLEIMEDILHAKFSVPELSYKLKNTKDEELIEGNYWHDNFWGICSCKDCLPPGRNNLGKLLMKIRSEI